ncbi:hypothetical protein OKW38_002754 [Paraburkholderia sp. MM5496-R1]|uniref:hypothetical protein n=1 Tax=Paraburkholderia sp. MM5496-R1 TaxID=2991065 RepID=UPI003D229ECE
MDVDFTECYRKAVAERIEQEVRQSDIVVPAPPNFWFEKLSGRYASHFIRAESLLQSTATIELLALALLKPFHDWWAAQKSSQRVRTSVYIDTMGIWPLAEKLAQLHRCEGRGDTEYIIESFKSYEGLDRWTPLGRPAFVLISASTSGSLEARVRERLSPAAIHVYTLVRLKSGERGAVTDGSDVLYELPVKLVGAPALNDMRSEFVASANALPLGDESIQISGERFLSRYAKPRLVRLVYKALSEATRSSLPELATTNQLSAGQVKFDGASRWSITFDGKLTQKAISSAPTGKASLLKDWLKNYAFPGPVAVVYPASGGSASREVTADARAVADAAALELNQYPGTDAVVLSSDDLLATSKVQQYQLDSRGFVVICPVIGSGFVFKQISALLRTIQKSGPRLFLSYVALPESEAQFSQLKQDLSRSDASVSYTFVCQHAFPVGRLEQALNWQAELEVLRQLIEDLKEQRLHVPTLLGERVSDLEGGVPLAGNRVFLPTLAGVAPKLSSGFALWTGSDKIFGEHLGAAVLLTVAALVEATRAANSKTPATTLGKSLFQQALLDPENFTRYNDGVIQAAMLRAGYPSELDYRSHPGASNDMARLMTKWIQLASHPIGDAAPEFLLAMATGKLRLCPHHERAVLQEAMNLETTSWLTVLAKICWTRWAYDKQSPSSKSVNDEPMVEQEPVSKLQ